MTEVVPALELAITTMAAAVGSPAANSVAPAGAPTFNSGLHPRAYHGRFTQSTGGKAPTGKAPAAPPLDAEDKSQLQQAAHDRKMAVQLFKQADKLDAQATALEKQYSSPSGKASSPLPQNQLAGQQAAATAAANPANNTPFTTPFVPSNPSTAASTTAAATTTASTIPPAIQQQINALTTRANSLRSYASNLLQQAAKLTQEAQLSRTADTVARRRSRSGQLSTIDLAASPTSAAGRRANAKKGNALSDGSFPIPNTDYLHRAIRAVGRAPASKRPAIKRLILKRARQLGTSVRGSWVQPGKKAMSMSNFDLAASATGSMDGPRVVASAATKLGLRPHQVRAYAKLRKRGVSHSNAYTFARRVQSRANEMGTARYAADHDVEMDLASTESGSNAFGTSTLLRGKNPGGGTTPQQSVTLKVSASKKVSQNTNAGAMPKQTPPGSNLLKAYNVPKNKTTESGGRAPTPGRSVVSAGRYANWPDNNTGHGAVPRTPVSTGAGFKTPTNLKMKGYPSNELGDMSRKGKNAYKRLRGAGVSHATAFKVAKQYYGAGKPSNQLHINKGGPQTNLRIKNNGIGSARPSPKAT